jgi:hypothetical protein
MAPWREALLLAASLAVLYVVAWVSKRLKSAGRAAAPSPAVSARTV